MEEVKKEIMKIIMQNDITGDIRHGLRVALDIITKHYPDIKDERVVNGNQFKDDSVKYKLENNERSYN